LSGYNNKAPGFAGGYLLGSHFHWWRLLPDAGAFDVIGLRGTRRSV
jgi:hypothetical protein